MSEEQNRIAPQEAATPRWVGIVVVVLTAISLVALGAGWTAATRSKGTEKALAAQAQSDKQSQMALEQRLQQDDETNAQMQGELSVITDRLKLTQGELAKARYLSLKFRKEDAKELAEMQQQVSSQLQTKASADDVNKLSGDVNGIKTNLDSTQQNLELAKDQFGNLIARNHEEIEELRRMGQRDYFEFSLSRKGERKKVGDLALELRGTNSKKQLFSVYLFADDLRFEKKNRSAMEPIYFYTHEYKTPLELVINKVGKNKVSGYLSVPKSAATASQPSTGTGE